MPGRYYVEAADWLRAIGVKVVEVDDWETRARSSGGFAAPPLGVQWHHTGSSGQHPLNDITYMTRNAQFRPIGNCYLWIDGTCYLLAAGAANTAGKGGPYQMSRGMVPADKGNTTTWAIEAANNGVGQVWPQVQVDAFFKISNELNFKFGNQPTDLFTHQSWTPGRKVDPATAAAVLGPWKPQALNQSGSWSVADVKAEAQRRWAGVTPQPKPDEENDVTQEDIDKIVDGVLAKVGAKVWQFQLGNITTAQMDEAGDIMRSGAHQSYKANPDNRK